MTPVPAARMVLASASAGRRALLVASGIDPVIIVSDVDEPAVAAASGLPESDAPGITLALARAKAQSVADRVRADDLDPDSREALGGPATAERPVLVIGADSMLCLDGQVLGKARDAAEVRRRWSNFAGRWADLVTGHVVVELPSMRVVSAAVTTRVRAAHPSESELADYIATGEPLAVAGSATIDGFGAAFLAEIAGDPSNVIGLSLPQMRLLVAELGHQWTRLWRPASTHPASPEHP
jgi:septum formation protein